MSNSPVNFNGLDSTVHGPVRLGVLTSLQIDGALDFTTLKKRLAVADGALGLHLGKLADIGYVSCRKRFCLLYTSPSPRDGLLSRMPSSA